MPARARQSIACVARVPTLDNSYDPVWDGEKYEGSYTSKSAKPGSERRD